MLSSLRNLITRRKRKYSVKLYLLRADFAMFANVYSGKSKASTLMAFIKGRVAERLASFTNRLKCKAKGHSYGDDYLIDDESVTRTCTRCSVRHTLTPTHEVSHG